MNVSEMYLSVYQRRYGTLVGSVDTAPTCCELPTRPFKKGIHASTIPTFSAFPHLL